MICLLMMNIKQTQFYIVGTDCDWHGMEIKFDKLAVRVEYILFSRFLVTAGMGNVWGMLQALT